MAKRNWDSAIPCGRWESWLKPPRFRGCRPVCYAKLAFSPSHAGAFASSPRPPRRGHRASFAGPSQGVPTLCQSTLQPRHGVTRARSAAGSDIEAFCRALQHKPSMIDADINVASSFQRPGPTRRSGRRQPLRARPGSAKSALATAHLAGKSKCREKWMPQSRPTAGPWSSDPANAAWHSNLIYTLNFHPGYDAAMLLAEHRAWARRHADPLTGNTAPPANGARRTAAEDRLRVAPFPRTRGRVFQRADARGPRSPAIPDFLLLARQAGRRDPPVSGRGRSLCATCRPWRTTPWHNAWARIK